MSNSQPSMLHPKRFFAIIMFDNHTFRKTDCQTLKQLHTVISWTAKNKYPGEDRAFALFRVNHADFKDADGKFLDLYSGTVPEMILKIDCVDPKEYFPF